MTIRRRYWIFDLNGKWLYSCKSKPKQEDIKDNMVLVRASDYKNANDEFRKKLVILSNIGDIPNARSYF